MKRKQDDKELLTDAFEYAKDAKGFLYKTAEAIRQVEGEDSYLFQRFDSHYNDVDDSIDDFRFPRRTVRKRTPHNLRKPVSDHLFNLILFRKERAGSSDFSLSAATGIHPVHRGLHS